MVYKNPLYKLIFTSVLSGLALGALGWFFIRLSLEVLNSVNILSSIESRIATLESDRKAVFDLAEVFKNRSVDLERIGKFLIDRERPVEFIEALEKLADSTRNKIAIDVISPSRQDPASILEFRLTIEGERIDVFRYLALLEFMPYEVLVEDVSYQELDSGETIGKARPGVKARLAILIKVKTRS